ncbi:MAG: DegQ family serine endoprotease [Gammaproteobacteria bacterium]|nr:DegQ family serine endoprotease [Gammaproteobacteria bacterium]MBU1414807.1 DegQ family serine endoprotease [Gammaproteobacteria bacterium]
MIVRALVAMWLAIVATAGLAQMKELPDFTELAEEQGPAVVNVSTTQIIKGQRFGHAFPFDENDPAFELFRRFLPRQMPGIPHEFKNQSLGSGFIVSADGYILTNAHVVDEADEVLVKLIDKREFKAKVVGTDKRTDVALLKIDATALPVVKLGDPEQLKVGEWVVAIGAPFGFDNSVTAGIVSAKGRSLPQENYVPFIQTDVAINPGNSGGPLFNMKGEVVGINSQIYSRSGGYMGVSFAIPIDVAMEVQAQLRSGGKVSRGRLGVAIQEVTRELADSFGLSDPEGALVASVEKGAPADKAGIEAGDIILKFNGKSVVQSGNLPRMVGATKPGTRVPVQVWRKGSTRTLMVSVGEMPGDGDASPRSGSTEKGRGSVANRLGLVVSELSSEQMKQAGVAHGLVVREIVSDGTRTDLRPGDIILSMIRKGRQTDLKSVEQFNGLLAKVDKSSVFTLLVLRGEIQTFVTIRGIGDK